MYVCALCTYVHCVRMCTLYIPNAQRPEEGARSPETGVNRPL